MRKADRVANGGRLRSGARESQLNAPVEPTAPGQPADDGAREQGTGFDKGATGFMTVCEYVLFTRPGQEAEGEAAFEPRSERGKRGP